MKKRLAPLILLLLANLGTVDVGTDLQISEPFPPLGGGDLVGPATVFIPSNHVRGPNAVISGIFFDRAK